MGSERSCTKSPTRDKTNRKRNKDVRCRGKKNYAMIPRKNTHSTHTHTQHTLVHAQTHTTQENTVGKNDINHRNKHTHRK